VTSSEDGAGCSNESLSPIRFEINIVGLRKITTDWETLQPGERATKSRSAVNEDSGTLQRGLAADGFALADRSVKSKNFGVVSKQKRKRIDGLNGATSPRLDATQSVLRVEVEGVRRPTPSGRSSKTA
jgi:hypothetical protein